MIVVTVGTNEAPFDRLLEALQLARPREEMLVQHGPSQVRPDGASYVEFLSYDELVDAIRRARAVVMHAGVGSIMTALANGQRPIVMPRLRRFGEAVDDHQLPLGRRLHDAGLVTLVERAEEMSSALDGVGPSSGLDLGPNPRLVAELKEFVGAHRRSGRR